MLIKEIALKTYRCYREVTVNCERLTAILGRNGSGKSTILNALDVFYDIRASVTADDFYGGDTNLSLEIRVVYSNLNVEELKEFESYIDQDTLAISKKIRFDNGKIEQKYYGATRQIPELAKLAGLSTSQKREQLNALDIGIKSVRGDDPDKLIAQYTAEHTDHTEWIAKEAQFFGPKNIGGGLLDK